MKMDSARAVKGSAEGSESQQLGGCHDQNWQSSWPTLGRTVDLDRPSKFIETTHGTLIQDENFGNKVYLKGLLPEGNSSAKRFKFGYNLVEGVVNRDIQRLFDPREESKVLAKIWEEPIRKNVGSNHINYVDMLVDQAQWADVNLAEDEASESTAKMVWQHLLKWN